jgi:hypothetical protein
LGKNPAGRESGLLSSRIYSRSQVTGEFFLKQIFFLLVLEKFKKF